ncbi:hypothetical protein SC206_02090 [Rouxiella sp. T17]|uniref:hypothetical protein n=1 Tax=Rouxiella sp. T17 TaxID=3085684 RepID=UPI002FC7B87F
MNNYESSSFETHDIFCKLNITNLSEQETLLLATYCEESIEGLCQTLSFIGNTLVTLADKQVVEFSTESLNQLGQSLATSASLILSMSALQKIADKKLLNDPMISNLTAISL